MGLPYLENVIVAPKYIDVMNRRYGVECNLRYEVMYTLVFNGTAPGYDSESRCDTFDNRDKAIAFAESLRVEYKIVD